MDGTIHPLYEGITVPLPALRAALSVASKEETRPYLNGVFVHYIDGDVRLVATDGHRMVVASCPWDTEPPAWLEGGIILDREGLTRPLGFLASQRAETARIAYLEGAQRAVLSDPEDTASFKVSLVDGTFPDYTTVINTIKVFGERKLSDMASTVYSPSYLKGVGDLAKILDADEVRLHGAENTEDPTLITFPSEPRVVMILMPMRGFKDKALPSPTVKLVEGPVARTIAALRAHQTRAKNRMEQFEPGSKAFGNAEAKVVAYEKRIASIVAGDVPALPAPEPETPPDEGVTVETAEHGEVHDTPDGCAPAHGEVVFEEAAE